MVVTDMSTFVLIFIILIFILLWFKDYIRSCILAFSLKGPPALPLLGNALLFNPNDTVELFTKAGDLYHTTMRLWVSFIPYVCVIEPKYLQKILSSSKVEKDMMYTGIETFLGRGLTTLRGEEWRFHRKIIQPFFNINILVQFIEIFCEGTNTLVNTLKSKTEVNIAPLINDCIFKMLHSTMLGVPTEGDCLNDSPFRKSSSHILDRLRKPWLLIEPLFNLTAAGDRDSQQKNELYNHIKDIVQKRITELKNGAPPRLCLMDFLIESSEKNSDFTTDDIIKEISTFMLAGQESVATTIAMALYYIAKDEKVQEKIVKEQLSLNINEDELTVDDLNKMVYLEQCINETLRLIPAGPILSRIAKEDINLHEFTIPKGTNLIISSLATHRSSQIYTNPTRYDPERFSSENIKKRNPFAFIPFLAGPRNCIGYKYAYIEMKTVLSIILRNYKLSMVAGREEIEMYFRVTLRARGGIWLNVKPRK